MEYGMGLNHTDKATIGLLQSELATLRAENAVLKAALREIYGNGYATGRNPQLMCDIAKEALK